MGAWWSDSNISQKPDRFNVKKLPNEIVLETEFTEKKQDPGIGSYYNGNWGIDIFRSEPKEDCWSWNN